MTHSAIANIKKLTSLLLKSFGYVVITVSVMGMFNPPNPLGPNNYNVIYNGFTQEYNTANGRTNQKLTAYNNALRSSVTNLLNGAQQAANWAEHQSLLAEINANKAELIYTKIDGIYSKINIDSNNARLNKIAIQGGQRPGRLQRADQNLVNAVNAARRIQQNARSCSTRARNFANQARNAQRQADIRRGNIDQIRAGLNRPIFDANYTDNNIQAFNNQCLIEVPTNFRESNEFSLTSRDRATEAHNEVVELDQLMHDIQQIANDNGIVLP